MSNPAVVKKEKKLKKKKPDDSVILVMSSLSKSLARAVFDVGDEPYRKCGRICFKLINKDGIEVDGGGLCEEALAKVLRKYLENHVLICGAL